MGRGKVEGQLSLFYYKLGGQGENGESPAVQSGRALPKSRCASPPWPSPTPAYTSSTPSAPGEEGSFPHQTLATERRRRVCMCVGVGGGSGVSKATS